MAQVNLGQNKGFRPQEPTQNKEDEEYIGQHNPRPVVVQRSQNADQVLRHVQQNNFGGHNNIINIFEQMLSQSGLNMGLHIPNFISPLSEYVRQTELARGWKVPKFTNFAGDTSDSIV